MDPEFKLGNVGFPNDTQRARNEAVSQVKWTDFRFFDLPSDSQFKGKINLSKVLQGSHLACTVSSDAAKWSNRVVFIEKIVSDILGNCPKDEELFIVSLGSNQLLVEYIVGKTLFEKGYKKIKFLMVDPCYLAAKENISSLPYLVDFKQEIALVYQRENGEPLAQDRIKYLSRAQNIKKYFTENANVIVIESLPPYSEVIKDMKIYKVEPKNEENLLSGSRIVPFEQANTVSFIPSQILEIWKEKGTDISSCLPLPLFELDKSSPHIKSFATPRFMVDWGCKIYKDGSYSLSFTGAKRFFASCLDNNRPPSLEKVDVLTQRTITLITNIKEIINSRVEVIKTENSNKQLSQENVTELLHRISILVKETLPMIECFYTADFVVDRKEALDYLTLKAGHHYRKTFQFRAHAENTYEIVEKRI